MTTATKIKNLFPKLKRGGYTARFIFTDERRGEMFFDSEWDIRDYTTAGFFTIGCRVDYRGNICRQSPSSETIGVVIRPGDQISVTATRWNMRGRHHAGGRLITVTGIQLSPTDGTVTIGYK